MIRVGGMHFSNGRGAAGGRELCPSVYGRDVHE